MTGLSKFVCVLCAETQEAAAAAAFPPKASPGKGRAVKFLGTPCDHVFHRTCLRNWFRNECNARECPQCGQSLLWKDVTPVTPLPLTTAPPTGGNPRSPTKTPSTSSSEEVLSLVAEEKQRRAEQLLEQRLAAAQTAKRETSEKQKRRAAERRQALLERRQTKRPTCPSPSRKFPRWVRLFQAVGVVLLLLFLVYRNSFVVHGPPPPPPETPSPVPRPKFPIMPPDYMMALFLKMVRHRMAQSQWKNPFLKEERRRRAEFMETIDFQMDEEQQVEYLILQDMLENMRRRILETLTLKHKLESNERAFLHGIMMEVTEGILDEWKYVKRFNL